MRPGQFLVKKDDHPVTPKAHFCLSQPSSPAMASVSPLPTPTTPDVLLRPILLNASPPRAPVESQTNDSRGVHAHSQNSITPPGASAQEITRHPKAIFHVTGSAKRYAMYIARPSPSRAPSSSTASSSRRDRHGQIEREHGDCAAIYETERVSRGRRAGFSSTLGQRPRGGIVDIEEWQNSWISSVGEVARFRSSQEELTASEYDDYEETVLGSALRHSP